MKPFPVSDPFAGEKLLVIDPALAPFIAAESRSSRLHFFPGRHLSPEHLAREQAVRVHRLLRRGQAVTAGIVNGFEVSLTPPPSPPAFTVEAGFGLTAAGEDVVVQRQTSTPIASLPVWNPSTRTWLPNLGALQPARTTPFAAVLLWQPVAVLTEVAPASLTATEDPLAAGFSDRIPEDESFYRRTQTDGARLVLSLWPGDWCPEPLPGPHWQNRLAWAVFQAEQGGTPPPWLTLGLPVALVGLDPDFRPRFVDRPAVVRRGGSPRRRAVGPGGMERRLWQAQVDQFGTHLAATALEGPALAHFRKVPPLGLLPRSALQLQPTPAPGPAAGWKLVQSFFPATYRIDARVCLLEQLETVFESARGLAPYDLTVPDAVTLLLPVSQRFFDPQLLEIATVSPEFDTELTERRAERGKWLARRAELRGKQKAQLLALTSQAPTFPDPDPEQLESVETPANGPLDPVEEAYGTTPKATAWQSDALEQLKAKLPEFLKRFDDAEKQALTAAGQADYVTRQSQVQDDERDALGKLGLRGFIEYLEAKADQADSLVDRGFLKVNTDVYRLGQLLGNNAIGTQFATSASLGTQVSRSTALASSATLNAFSSRLFADLATPTTGAAPGVQPAPPTPQPVPGAGPTPTPAPALAGAAFNNFRVTSKPASDFLTKFVTSNEKLATTEGLSDLTELDRLVADNPSAKRAVANLRSTGLLDPEAGNALKRLSAFSEAYVPNLSQITTKQLRTLPFERLPIPDAPKVRGDLFNTKLEIFDQLMLLDLSLANLTSDFVASPTDDAPAGTPPPTAPAKPIRWAFHKILTSRNADALGGDNSDEAVHFSRGVKHADMSIASLRAVADRIQLYRRLIALCRATLAEIEAHLARLTTRLQSVGDELSETRHDVAVAQALLKEEAERIKGINDRRATVLQEHVNLLVFHRPRSVEGRIDVPVRVLEPSLRVAPVPACLAEDLPQPPDFQALAEVLRHSPAAWFKHAPRWIEQVNQLEPLRTFVARAAERSLGLQARLPVASSGRFSVAVSRVIRTRLAVSTARLPAVQTLTPTVVASLSWSGLVHRAQAVLTLGQLVDAGPAGLARIAAEELTNLFKVGACLHQDFSRTTPFLRLLWAEQFSQFDGPADFRDLSQLPRWSEVAFTLRRELQAHTDWLYSRVDASQPDALELIHDLVRVALLLASHAPVNQLLTGQLAESVPQPSPGARLPLRVDPRFLRIGMEVLIDQPHPDPRQSVRIRAVIEDLNGDQASARITALPQSGALDPAKATVRFSASRSILAR